MSFSTWTGVGTAPSVSSHSQTHPRILVINFSESMNNDAELIDITNYSIAGISAVSVTRNDADTVTIVFDNPIPEGSNDLTVIGPMDLALNAMNGTYTFTAMEHFKIIDIKPYGSKSFIAYFSRIPYTGESSANSAIERTNWDISLDGDQIAVTLVETLSSEEIDHIIIHVTRDIFRSNVYDIVLSSSVKDVDMLDFIEDNEQTSLGYVRRKKEIFEIISGTKVKAREDSPSGRYSSLLLRTQGGGYAFRKNKTTAIRSVIRMVFSSMYYHIPSTELLGLKPKTQMTRKLDLLRKDIIRIANNSKDVISCSCSIKFKQSQNILEIAMRIVTKYGDDNVSFALSGDGSVQYV